MMATKRALLGLGLLLTVEATVAFIVNPALISPHVAFSNWNKPLSAARRTLATATTVSYSPEALWNRSRSGSWRGRPLFMSPAEDATVEKARSIKVQASGGGGGDKPPDTYEQSEPEVVGSFTSTVFVAGGSGFVGSEICSQLVEAGCNVIALSRKGAPTNGGSWVKSVKWVQGNALNQEAYRAELRKSDTVISCVGGFGKTDAYMGLVNGEANIKLAEAAADAGVKQFVFLSVHDYKAPQFVKRVGYFDGKRRAEKVIGELFGYNGVILKPAFIYGERKVKVRGPDGQERDFKLPLQRVGGPLAKITSTGIGKKIAESGLPLADVVWTQPLSKEWVAKSAVRCCLEGVEAMQVGGKGKDSGDALVLKVQDIVELVSPHD